MSITLDKLRALKRQAGGDVPAARGQHASPAPQTRADAPVLHDPAALTGSLPPTHTEATPLPVRPTGGMNGHDAPPPPEASDGTRVHRTASQPGPRRPPPAGPAEQQRAGSFNALRRLLDVRERRPSTPAARTSLNRALPGEEIAPGLHYLETRVAYPTPDAALPLAFARREGTVDPRALLFFDTETTGLAGGTGTRAFMIGAADWHDDALRVRQLLIGTMAAESAMLREFATWLSPETVLASYNGRCYDAPLLKTRYRLARLPDPLQALDHLDLLHPTRRRYRGRWENCRLATIERELLRIVREDDLPGSQAPMAWLGYLRGGASTLLHRVAAHNHQDVVTLARLLTCLADVDGDVESC